MSSKFRLPRLFAVVACLLFLMADGSQALARPYGSQSLLRLANNRVGILVTINGQGPFVFCLDTGTSKTVLTPALRDRLGLHPLPGPPVDVITAAGKAKSSYYLVEEVAASGVIVEGQRGVVVDLPPELNVMGAIGGDFLSNFIVDLDLRRQRITLHHTGSVAKWPGLVPVRGRFDDHGIVIVPARMDSTSVEAVLDTGAQSTVGNLQLGIAIKGAGLVVLPDERQIGDARKQRVSAMASGFQWFRLGPATWSSRQIMVSEMPGFHELGLGSRPAVFVGMDLLAGRRIVFDYGAGEIWLER